jgi:hypothetical protein
MNHEEQMVAFEQTSMNRCNIGRGKATYDETQTNPSTGVTTTTGTYSMCDKKQTSGYQLICPCAKQCKAGYYGSPSTTCHK